MRNLFVRQRLNCVGGFGRPLIYKECEFGRNGDGTPMGNIGGEKMTLNLRLI